MAVSSERLAARRRHLVEVAQALIRERGDAGFSMALLAARAGVSPATPYNLLRSKSEILRLVVRDDLERFIRRLEALGGDAGLAGLLGAADQLVGHYEADRQFHRGLFRAAFSADAAEVRDLLSAASRAWWGGLVGDALDRGDLTGLVLPGQLTDVLLRTMGGVAQTWLAEGWGPARFGLEMSLSVRLVLASVAAPARRDAMVAEIADLQSRLSRLASADKPPSTAPPASGFPPGKG